MICVLCHWEVDTTRTGSVRFHAGWAHDICVQRDQAHCFNCGNDLPCPEHSDGADNDA